MSDLYLEAMIFGFLLGDGWMSCIHNGIQFKKQCGFSGDENSLKQLKEDLVYLYSDIGKATISTKITESIKYNIVGTTTKMVVNTKIFNRYLELGMPVGRRVEQHFLLPNWITNGEEEIKSAFLSGLYAAEGFTPSMQKNDKTPKTMGLNLSKRFILKDEFDIFMKQIESILDELGIKYSRYEKITFTCEQNIKISLIFSNSNENILRLAEVLDLRYSIFKRDELNFLDKYTKLKNSVLKNLELAYCEAMDRSITAKSIANKYNIKQRQIENWRVRKTGIRIPNGFPTFTEFKQLYSSL